MADDLPEFDPSQPYQVGSAGPPEFDPSKPFTVPQPGYFDEMMNSQTIKQFSKVLNDPLGYLKHVAEGTLDTLAAPGRAFERGMGGEPLVPSEQLIPDATNLGMMFGMGGAGAFREPRAVPKPVEGVPEPTAPVEGKLEAAVPVEGTPPPSETIELPPSRNRRSIISRKLKR